jgi:tRNA pseudouridine38-40 synthase
MQEPLAAHGKRCGPPPDTMAGTPARRLALRMEYEGTRYVGFQAQWGKPTIQGELERCLAQLTGEQLRVRGASRTDAGAHAQGQVVDFLTASLLPLPAFVGGLNFYLPADIKVQAAYEMELPFHSRRDASGRTYRYQILNRPAPSPLLRRTCHWVREPLDAAAMARAAQCLAGRHDFRVLAPGFRQDRSAVREVLRWLVWREDEAVQVECEANGFLPHQIRRANGLLIEVGKGRRPENIVEEVLEGRVPPGFQWPSAPACGLCLMAVAYPNFGAQVKASTDEADQHLFPQGTRVAPPVAVD